MQMRSVCVFGFGTLASEGHPAARTPVHGQRGRKTHFVQDGCILRTIFVYWPGKNLSARGRYPVPLNAPRPGAVSGNCPKGGRQGCRPAERGPGRPFARPPETVPGLGHPAGERSAAEFLCFVSLFIQRNEVEPAQAGSKQWSFGNQLEAGNLVSQRIRTGNEKACRLSALGHYHINCLCSLLHIRLRGCAPSGSPSTANGDGKTASFGFTRKQNQLRPLPNEKGPAEAGPEGDNDVVGGNPITSCPCRPCRPCHLRPALPLPSESRQPWPRW